MRITIAAFVPARSTSPRFVQNVGTFSVLTAYLILRRKNGLSKKRHPGNGRMRVRQGQDVGEYRIIMLMQRKIAEFEGLRVMLVEDDVLLAMEMEDLLGDMGCEVVGPFGKLPDALDAADRERFDGVLLDLNLRGELSFPLLDKLLEQNVPVVVCSGYVDLPGMNERLAEVPCLAKPCNIETLVSLMRQHFLDRASPSRQSAEKDSSHTRPVSG